MGLPTMECKPHSPNRNMTFIIRIVFINKIILFNNEVYIYIYIGSSDEKLVKQDMMVANTT